MPLQVSLLAMSIREQFSDLNEGYGSNTMNQHNYRNWKTNVTKAVNEIEGQYDLYQGEIFHATHTTDEDLQELYEYGWSPRETAMAVVEAVGLR